MGIPEAHEIFDAAHEVKLGAHRNIDWKQLDWIPELVERAPSPYVVLPGATTVKGLLFEQRWETPVTTPITFILEALWEGRNAWGTVDAWEVDLGGWLFGDLADRGRSYNAQPMSVRSLTRERPVVPDDLHDHTATEPVPEFVADQDPWGEPTYLDFPFDDNRE